MEPLLSLDRLNLERGQEAGMSDYGQRGVRLSGRVNIALLIFLKQARSLKNRDPSKAINKSSCNKKASTYE